MLSVTFDGPINCTSEHLGADGDDCTCDVFTVATAHSDVTVHTFEVSLPCKTVDTFRICSLLGLLY